MLVRSQYMCVLATCVLPLFILCAKDPDDKLFWLLIQPETIPNSVFESLDRKFATADECKISATTVDGGPICAGELIFEDNFNVLNTHVWKHDIRMPGSPDFEFNMYGQRQQNIEIANGELILKPNLITNLHKRRADVVTRGNVKLDGCTAGEGGKCHRKSSGYTIVQPVITSRLRTKDSFSFKYGAVEIRAKLPKGNWVFPEIWLEPKTSVYGKWYMSGKLVVAMAAGNRRLVNSTGNEIGASVLHAGCLYGRNNEVKLNTEQYGRLAVDRTTWQDEYHTYVMVWKTDSIKFFVDGVQIHQCLLPSDDPNGAVAPWRRGTKTAPFDDEFYLTLGLGVGGIREFADHTKTLDANGNVVEKPWKNLDPKSTFTFWEGRDNWTSTWNDETALRIDYVKVWADRD